MNISFKEYLLLLEGKQVGTLYHFTRLSSLFNMIIDDFNLETHQDYFSFTRNYNIVDFKKYKNDFSLDWELFNDKRIVRIDIDGNKLSNYYKVQPFIDQNNNIKRVQGEWEEIVKYTKDLNVSRFILRIDIFQDQERFNKTLEYIKTIKNGHKYIKLLQKVKLSKGFTKY
jgi:hypothetical protein